MLNNLENKIMEDLKFGFRPDYFSAKRYEVTQEEFNIAVRHLAQLGKLTHDEHTHVCYKGDVRNIRITTKGKNE